MKHLMDHPAEIEAFADHLATLEKEGYFVAGLLCSHVESDSKIVLIPSQLLARGVSVKKAQQFLTIMCAMVAECPTPTKITKEWKRSGSFFNSKN